ncbi:MAG: hypothetical protein JWQ38_544 [Flavipsychrobacter sp.]|nr:hypothetical protein [Flavipsychrobacter sp.]
MLVKQYELAIELSDGGEWICDVTEHNEQDVMRYEIQVDPPLFRDGNSEPFPMEMLYDTNGQLVFVTEHALTEELRELEDVLAKEIIEGIV